MKFSFLLVISFVVFAKPAFANDMFCDSNGNITSEITDSNGIPNRLYSAIGCLEIDKPNSTIEFFIKWSLGVVGGTAFLMLIYATIQIITSSGNPDKLKSAKELFMSVLAGVLLLILSVIILEVIGVNILQIPGL